MVIKHFKLKKSFQVRKLPSTLHKGLGFVLATELKVAVFANV